VSFATLVFGCILMWILAWLTTTPVRVVRAALRRVEQSPTKPPVRVRYRCRYLSAKSR
jgi:hypothetical protein